MFWLKCIWFHGLLLKFLQQIFHQTLLCQTVQSETPRYVFCFAVFGRSLQQHIGFIKRALLQIDFFACFLKSFIKLFLFPSKIILVRLRERVIGHQRLIKLIILNFLCHSDEKIVVVFKLETSVRLTKILNLPTINRQSVNPPNLTPSHFIQID